MFTSARACADAPFRGAAATRHFGHSHAASELLAFRGFADNPAAPGSPPVCTPLRPQVPQASSQRRMALADLPRQPVEPEPRLPRINHAVRLISPPLSPTAPPTASAPAGAECSLSRLSGARHSPTRPRAADPPGRSCEYTPPYFSDRQGRSMKKLSVQRSCPSIEIRTPASSGQPVNACTVHCCPRRR